jgi:hypothetical protein
MEQKDGGAQPWATGYRHRSFQQGRGARPADEVASEDRKGWYGRPFDCHQLDLSAICVFLFDRSNATVRHRLVVPMKRLGNVASAVLALCGLLVGCGGDESGPRPKKVDVSAQVAALKGNGDAKANALSELAAGGANSAAATPQIIPLLKDEDPVVRRLAAYAIGQIGPAAKAALPDLKALLQDNDRNVVTAAVNAIRAVDPKNAPADAMPNTM